MISPRRGVTPLVVSILCSTLIPQVSALTAAYCSSLNTASTGKNTSIYQSNGLCHDFCIDDYAFAVLQDDGCWCSNYVPGSTVDTSNCDENCPGYPSDSCGSLDNDLYEYLSLTLAASGTKTASSSSASSTSQQPATVTETVAPVTVTATPTSASETSASSTTSSTSPSSTSPSSTPSSSTTHTTTTSSSSSSSTDDSTSSTWTPTAVASVYTVTGKVMTVLVTPTTPPSASETSSASLSNKKKSSGLSTGAAVGLTVGLVALVALIGVFAFLFMRRRKQAAAENYNTVSRNDSVLVNTAAGKPPSRSMSENSRYVLGTDGRQVVETWEPADNRRSQLIPVDPRLNPFTPLYQRGDGSKSRDSVNTLRDDHDYSRRINQQGPILRATNPDPDP